MTVYDYCVKFSLDQRELIEKFITSTTLFTIEHYILSSSLNALRIKGFIYFQLDFLISLISMKPIKMSVKMDKNGLNEDLGT